MSEAPSQLRTTRTLRPSSSCRHVSCDACHAGSCPVLPPPPPLQLCTNTLFLFDLWVYLGAALNVGLVPPAGAALDPAAAGGPALSRWGVLWGSWWLLAFAAANTFGVCFGVFILGRDVVLALNNMTLNEVGLQARLGLSPRSPHTPALRLCS